MDNRASGLVISSGSIRRSTVGSRLRDPAQPTARNTTPPVFIQPADDNVVLAELAPGGQYSLTGTEARHAQVLRVQPGEPIDVVDGNGTRLRGVAEAVTSGSSAAVTLRVSEVIVEPAPPVTLTLVQALAKESRDLAGVEMAVECGVGAVIPWLADRSIVRWSGAKVAKGEAKWAATIAAATKQSRRATLPSLGSLLDSRGLTRLIATTVSAGRAALILDGGAEAALTEATLPQAGDILIIVGPEGGISPAELAAFSAAGAQAVRLGPHVLRTSTAGPVAVASLAQQLGLWDDAAGPSERGLCRNLVPTLGDE